jgi:hypothetical protein
MALKRVSGEKEIDGVSQVLWKFAGYATPVPTITAPTETSTPVLLPPVGTMKPAMNPSPAQPQRRTR